MVNSLGHWVEKLSKAKYICVGDVMLDRFVWGDVERICPEAPIPVLRVRKEQEMMGGAGNVVRNLDALGLKGSLISLVGDDTAGKSLDNLTGELDSHEKYFLHSKQRPTTVKVRYISSGQQLLRTDTEDISLITDAEKSELQGLFRQKLLDQDVVILSDYAKGVLTDELTQDLIATAHAAQKKVVADPKGRDFSKYSGSDVLTPNKSELAFATGLPVNTDHEIELAARSVMSQYGIQAIVVTRSAEGMSVVTQSSATHIPTTAREVYDVSGAGDTVVATLSAAYSIGASLEEAAKLANLAAGIVVGKVGTAVVHHAELLDEIHHQDIHESESAIVSSEQAASMTRMWQKSGQKIVFTNGCFDLLHPGHLSLLKQARAAGNRLIIGLNTDASVKRLKGDERPIQTEMARAVVLSSLELVDLVVLFDEDTPLELIKTIRPDVLVKGADYKIEDVVGADVVQSYGGQVVLAKLEPGQSTTNTVLKLAKSA